MDTKQHLGEPEAYWTGAGEVSYAQAMYSSADVERHVRLRLWTIAVDIAAEMRIPNSGRVLDFGCGDGAFANERSHRTSARLTATIWRRPRLSGRMPPRPGRI